MMTYLPPLPQQQVSRKRITGGAHVVHAILSVFTCGLWGIVWFLHWLFTRSKTITYPTTPSR